MEISKHLVAIIAHQEASREPIEVVPSMYLKELTCAN